MREHRIRLPMLGDTRIRFAESAESIYEIYEDLKEFDRQKKIRHLGLISDLVASATHTRYEYVFLQCGITQLLQSLHKGNPDLALGTIRVGDRRLASSEILKSWFLISNFGHARNTIGDERVLLAKAIEDSSVRRFLLNPILDDELREKSEEIIGSYKYQDFHFVIAIKRIYTELRQGSKKEEALEMLRLFLTNCKDISIPNRNRLDHLKKLFLKIRALSILSLDSSNSHIPLSIELGAAVSALAETEQFHIEKSINDSINPLLSWLFDELYTDRGVLALVKSYEKAAKLKIARETITPGALVRLAIKDGIVHEGDRGSGNHFDDEAAYDHFVRLPIPMYKEEALSKSIDRIASYFSDESDMTFIVDEVKPLNKRFVDVLKNRRCRNHSEVGKTIFKAAVYLESVYERHVTNITGINRNIIRKISRNLEDLGVDAERIAQSHDGLERLLHKENYANIKKEMMVGFRSLLWAMLRELVDTRRFKYVIEPQMHGDLLYGVRVPACYSSNQSEKDFLSDVFELLLKKTKSESRRHEIEYLKRMALRQSDDFVFVCFSEVLFFERTANPERNRRGGVDGIIVRISEHRVKAELYEAKSNNDVGTRSRDAMRDLRLKVVPTLRANRPVKKIASHAGWGARLEFQWKF